MVEKQLGTLGGRFQQVGRGGCLVYASKDLAIRGQERDSPVIPAFRSVAFSLVDLDDITISEVSWDSLIYPDFADELVQLVQQKVSFILVNFSRDTIKSGGFVVVHGFDRFPDFEEARNSAEKFVDRHRGNVVQDAVVKRIDMVQQIFEVFSPPGVDGGGALEQC